MNIDKLKQIRHMLLTDEHTRRHWLFWTVYSSVDGYIRQWFEMRNLEAPCGAVGCAIGHAHRCGIIETDGFLDARHELDMDEDDYHFIFENGNYNRDEDTPDNVVVRIDMMLAKYDTEQANRNAALVDMSYEDLAERAPDGAMEVTDA